MISKNLRTSILTPIAHQAVLFSKWLASHSQDEENGIMIVHCMDARVNMRNLLKPYMVVPNALTPAGAIVTSNDLSVKKRFEVAKAKFAMHDIYIGGHQHCAAMGQLADVLLGKSEDQYYQNFLVSSHGFPPLDLSEYIDGKKIVTPSFTDNLSVLTALHTARNVLSINIQDGQSIGDLLDQGLVRIHIGYTSLDKSPLDKKWTEKHHLLSPVGNNLESTPNIAKAIIARRENTLSQQEFSSLLESAQKSFAQRLALAVSPTESLRA